MSLFDLREQPLFLQRRLPVPPLSPTAPSIDSGHLARFVVLQVCVAPLHLSNRRKAVLQHSNPFSKNVPGTGCGQWWERLASGRKALPYHLSKTRLSPGCWPRPQLAFRPSGGTVAHPVPNLLSPQTVLKAARRPGATLKRFRAS